MKQLKIIETTSTPKKEIMNNTTSRKDYQLIDIFKFICAIFVVMIHSQIMSDPNDNIQWYIMHVILRVAVPFFFIASGFLFGKKYLKDIKKLKENSIKQVKRLIIPFLFWSAVMVPYLVLRIEQYNNIFLNIFLNTLKIIYIFIVNPYHLWFVLALIMAIIIEYYFLKNGKIKIAIILSCILYFMALFGNSYYFLIEKTPLKVCYDMILKIMSTFRNGIFVGFPLFTIGVCVAYKEGKIKAITNNKLNFILPFFVFAQIMEATFIRGKNYKDDSSLFISIICIALILLIICIKYAGIKLKKIDTILLRNLSTGIFYMHYPICIYLKLFIPNINNWVLFLIVMFAVIIINTILLKINNKYINLLIK